MEGVLIVMNKLNKLDMVLQYFADPNNDPNQTGEGANPNSAKTNAEQISADPNAKDPKPNPDAELKYSDDDVNKIVQSKLAKAEMKRQADVKEAAKKAKMTAEQKKEYEFEQLEKENEELKAKAQHIELTNKARSELTKNGLNLTDEELDLVVTNDEESTLQNINVFKTMHDRLIQETKDELTKGKTPKTVSNPAKSITDEEFNKMSSQERTDLYKSNPDLFNKVTGGI